MDFSPSVWGLPGSSRLAPLLHLNVDNSVRTCLFCGGDGWLLSMVYSSSSVVRDHHQGLWWQHAYCLLGKSDLCRLPWCSGISGCTTPASSKDGPHQQQEGAWYVLWTPDVLWWSTGYSLFLLWECYVSAGEGMFFLFAVWRQCVTLFTAPHLLVF